MADKEQVLYASRIYVKAHEKEDPVGVIAAMNVFAQFPQDVQAEARQLAEQKYPNGFTIRRKGRRAVLREQDPNALLVKVSIAGSGYGKWKTDTDKDLCVPAPDEAAAYKWEKTNSSVTSYFRDTGKGPELLFAGPGGAGTTGADSMWGAFDRGSNTIDTLSEDVPRQVIDQISTYDPDDTRAIVVLIRAHSRGAVAAGLVANRLKEMYQGRISVELVQVDPVPGPSQTGQKLEIDVSGIDESTLIMSVDPGKGWYLNPSFTPQMVLGAKRIIISSQDHSTGLDEGFVYENRRYTGSSLNSLPDGLYLDKNKPGESQIPLEMVASPAEFNEAVVKMERINDANTEVGATQQGDYERGEQELRDQTYEVTSTGVNEMVASSSGWNNSARVKIIDEVLRNYAGVS